MTGWVAAGLLALGLFAALGNGQQADAGDAAVEAPATVSVGLSAGD